MIKATEDNQYVELTSPTSLPKASGFLWNEKMMIHVNCRGTLSPNLCSPNLPNIRTRPTWKRRHLCNRSSHTMPTIRVGLFTLKMK